MPFRKLTNGKDRRYAREQEGAEVQACVTAIAATSAVVRARFLRKFEMCRLCFRELALRGDIPGVIKSSW